VVVAEDPAVAREGIGQQRTRGLMLAESVLGDGEAVGCAERVRVVVAQVAAVLGEQVLVQSAADLVVAQIGVRLGETARRQQRVRMAGTKALGPGAVQPGGQVAARARVATDEQVPDAVAGQLPDVGVRGGGGVHGDQMRDQDGPGGPRACVIGVRRGGGHQEPLCGGARAGLLGRARQSRVMAAVSRCTTGPLPAVARASP
jgi:hypothetical protein